MKTALAALLVLTLAACSQAPEGTSISSTAARAAGAPASEVAAPSSSTAAPLPATTATAPAADATTMLTQYHWQLANAVDQSGAAIDTLLARPSQPVQLDFDARAVSIGNTCNRMHGNYSVAGGKLTIGNLASTMMACHDRALVALDQAAGKYLQGTFKLALDSHGKQPRLTLTTSGGDRLTFAGRPTADTRYGGSGRTMFLEVAPQTTPCSHPPTPDAQCLDVRELHYAANGVKQGKPGEWHALAQGIEGYTHRPGTRNVLRVKRYTLASPPADAASTAYVLDMVVETELPAAR
jgi:heat shock protein HslJ